MTALFGGAPDGVWAAPGRVNLIGEHTDHNEGLVLPFALTRTARVSARARPDGVLRLASTWAPEPVEVADVRPGAVSGWAAYPAGVVWALREAGHRVGGVDLLIDSDVPVGAGLSSSAAVECAVAVAVDELFGLGLGQVELAGVAQRAENDFVGVPCGILDQMAAMCCVEDHALFLDTRDLSSRLAPMALGDTRVLVIDTKVRHDLGDGGYAAVREACAAAARAIGVPALRDASLSDVDDLEEPLRGAARHVVTENARVLTAIDAMTASDWAALGRVLHDGHASLRDDLRVTCPETDLAASVAEAAGALGARQTGGGFGGSVIALVASADVERVTGAVAEAYARQGLAAPVTFTATAGPGARRVR